MSLNGLIRNVSDYVGDHNPTYADICVVRAMIKSLSLPTELVLNIMDYAQYRPFLEFSSTGAHDTTSAEVCLDAPVMTSDTIRLLQAASRRPKVREITFDIESHDQGWASSEEHGSFQGYSWLEVCISGSEASTPSRSHEEVRRTPGGLQLALASCRPVERPIEAEHGPQDGDSHTAWWLQANRVASVEAEAHHITWSTDSSTGNEGAGNGLGFINALQEEDRILILARAKYPGWHCYVNKITVRAHYDFGE